MTISWKRADVNWWCQISLFLLFLRKWFLRNGWEGSRGWVRAVNATFFSWVWPLNNYVNWWPRSKSQDKRQLSPGSTTRCTAWKVSHCLKVIKKRLIKETLHSFSYRKQCWTKIFGWTSGLIKLTCIVW